MIVTCTKCGAGFDDAYRWTVCPHETFPANDGSNNFRHHPEAYLGTPPKGAVLAFWRIVGAACLEGSREARKLAYALDDLRAECLKKAGLR
jgi:hypothetical protein